jgi:hypothetical protein
MKIDMPKKRALPVNQSATILLTSTNRKAAPMPLTARPVRSSPYEPATPLSGPPAAINAIPNSTIRLSPKRWPRKPPGTATTRPGSMKAPTSMPRSAQSMPRSRTNIGPTDPAAWNW